MAPKIKFTREDVLDAAFRLTCDEGYDAVNARAVAKRLGSSTQPLFRVFARMDDIRAEVQKMAYQAFKNYLVADKSSEMSDFKRMGMAYIRFGREEPHLFRMLFMCDRSVVNDENDAYAGSKRIGLQACADMTGFTGEKNERFYMHMWVFVHGMAVMAATKYLAMDDEYISSILTEHFRAVLDSFK